jgi:hypothetical protein
VTARDVAAIGKATVDRRGCVRVDAEGGTELTDRRQPGTGQQAARIDLVGELPEDLGRDRDVRVALDVEAAAGSAPTLWSTKGLAGSIDIAR